MGAFRSPPASLSGGESSAPPIRFVRDQAVPIPARRPTDELGRHLYSKIPAKAERIVDCGVDITARGRITDTV